MSWFLVTLRPANRILSGGGWSEADEAAVEAHFRRLARLREEGVVHFAGRTDEDDAHTFGLVLYRAENEDTGAALAADDPAVLSGTMTSELRPFRFAVGAPGTPGRSVDPDAAADADLGADHNPIPEVR
ncbi:MAG: YciI family protein [Rectinemataceae bacterium]